MSRNRGPFKISDSNVIYVSKWINLTTFDAERPSGEHCTFGIVSMQAGVSVLAYTRPSHIVLLREYRFAVDRFSLELPGGGLDEGETIEMGALRELEEETGFRGKKVEHLTCVDPFTSLINSPNHIVKVTDLEHGTVGSEDVIDRVIEISLEDALSLVLNGQISHAATCIGILIATIGRSLKCPLG